MTTRVVRSALPSDATIALGTTALAVAAMAVDHLLGDDPGLEDLPTFGLTTALSIALAAVVFGWVVPRARAASASSAEAPARRALVLGVLAFVPGVATLWLGFPFVLAGGGLALGLRARWEKTAGPATAAVVVAGAALALATLAYLGQAAAKLS
jgi:hypothetical protein